MIKTHARSPIDSRLQRELAGVAHRLRAHRLHALSAVAWAVVALGGILLLAAVALFPGIGRYAFPIMAVLVIGVALWLARRWHREPLDFVAAARLIEHAHPSLRQALHTALEQRRGEDGTFHFLQRRVIDQALEHARRERWDEVPAAHRPGPALAHAAAVLVVLALLAIAVRPAPVVAHLPLVRALQPTTIAVTPGDAEIERGSTVVITARFTGPMPAEVSLEQAGPGIAPETARLPMARSLSDPIYALTLPAVTKDVSYRVNYDGGVSEDFHLHVYDLPGLLKANADLDYPAYTGIAHRRIEDTRRISAVEGTQVDYEFLVNKPLQRAVLRGAEGDELQLTAANPERTRFVSSFPVTDSKRYTLHLVDDAGRTNRAPPDIRIEALPNQRPDLKLVFPRGDQSVSALEEISLEGSARDDFGLVDYGFGISVGNAEPVFVSLRRESPQAKGAATTAADFHQLLALESRDVAPGDLISWFAWADDLGPDGRARRTAGDLYFGEVRPFDEIFREEANASSQSQSQNGAGNQSADLLELQRQISLAIWKLEHSGEPGPTFADDLETLAGSQARAQEQLARLTPELNEERLRRAAAEAEKGMQRAAAGIADARQQTSTKPLPEAWRGAQGAVQALLRLQPRESRVAQSRNGSGGGGSASRQRQLDQLRFRSADDRYETASEAQALTTPEERAQLEVVARLRELARRQQDVNQRLQELQTALQAASDPAERERIERELKRLQEEQRRMLADLDEVRQRLDQQRANPESRDARQRLEDARESMRNSSEALERGEVSQALAEGTRTREGLEQVRDELRRNSSSRFAEQIREARRQARSLAENQGRTAEQLQQLEENGPRSLDGAGRRDELARDLDEQKAGLDRLLGDLRQITEAADGVEPALHRQLYDILRQRSQDNTGEQLQTAAELLRRGFVDQARDLQPPVSHNLQELRRDIERTADSILGDEEATMRFAENELQDLARQLEQEREAAGADDQNAQPGPPSENGRDAAGRRASNAPGEDAPALARDTAENPREQDRDRENAEGARGTPRDEGAEPAENEGDSNSERRLARNGGNSDQRSSAPTDSAGSRSNGNSSSGENPGEQGSPQLARDARGGRGGNASGGDRNEGVDESDRELARLTEALEAMAGQAGGGGAEAPLTGDGFGAWSDRLRTVEALLESPELRARLAAAGATAERLRAEFKRHGEIPQWGLVESGIEAPLSEVRTWLRQELARRENPLALQPVDRDPVPEKYAEAVQNYYEALGR